MKNPLKQFDFVLPFDKVITLQSFPNFNTVLTEFQDELHTVHFCSIKRLSSLINFQNNIITLSVLNKTNYDI